MLDVHRLTLLREVKLLGSMSAAARELAYSHSAISQQLGVLEKETGVILLEKVGRNVKLTPAGEELVRNTEAILAAIERAESDLATSHQRAQGVVTVAAFATISRSVMPTAMAELARNFRAWTCSTSPRNRKLLLCSSCHDRLMPWLRTLFPARRGLPTAVSTPP